MPEDTSDSSGRPSKELLEDRRRFLKILGVGSAAGLAGCTGGGGEDTPTPSPSPTETDDPDGTPTPTPTPEPLPEPSGTFRAARSSEASNLNFVYNQEAGAGAIIGLHMDTMYGIRPVPDGAGFEPFPQLGFPIQEDTSTYTIQLRDNLQYADEFGQVTASDIVYRIQNIYQADFSAEETGVDGGITNWTNYPDSTSWDGVTVEETGELSFRVTLDSPDPAYIFRPTLSALYAAPQALFEDYVDRAEAAVEDMSGSALEEQLGTISMELQNDSRIPALDWTGNLGPYNRDNWEQGSIFEASRDSNYYLAAAARGEGGNNLPDSAPEIPRDFQQAPYFENYESQVVPEQSARLQALRNNEIDSANVPPERVSEFQDLEQTYVNQQRQPFITPVIYNMRANGFLPFRTREVRQAFALALNKPQMVQNVWRGFALPGYTMQPQWSRWYPDSDDITEFGSEDLYGGEMARSRLQEGLDAGGWDSYSYDGDTLLNENNNQVQLSLIAQAGQPIETTIAESLKRQYEERLGIQVNISTVPGGAFVQNYARPGNVDGEVPQGWEGGFFNPGPRDVATSNEAWDISLIYGFNTYPLTPGDSDVFFFEDGSINYYGYVASEEYQLEGDDGPANAIVEAYEQAGQETDTETRRQLFSEAFSIIAEEQPFGFLAMEDDTIGYNSSYVGPNNDGPYLSGWDGETYYKEDSSSGSLRRRD